MEIDRLKKLLSDYKKGNISQKKIIEKLKILPYLDINSAKIDTNRSLKFGFPEVIYGEGKSISQLKEIIKRLKKINSNFMVTKLEKSVADKIIEEFPDLIYFPEGKILTLKKEKPRKRKYICVVSAGTSDLEVAEEASLTCEILGNKVKRIYDAGVAGLHRIIDKISILEKSKCVIVVAGMDGVLPSVIGGLVSRPVIAVPTSIGYGANFKGIAPLLTMLNSCSPNVVVVNINNGFGAGFFAHLITNKI
ncbi:MAG: nickel pincer cofactor biosynthesis protein LarB [Candidatus Omnitrophota bacterium]|nr:MAG: nickel pincer cofactor biosynthesis protein LarB [Candidatus Omnitrophota bacterium]